MHKDQGTALYCITKYKNNMTNSKIPSHLSNLYIFQTIMYMTGKIILRLYTAYLIQNK